MFYKQTFKSSTHHGPFANHHVVLLGFALATRRANLALVARLVEIGLGNENQRLNGNANLRYIHKQPEKDLRGVKWTKTCNCKGHTPIQTTQAR